MSLAEIGFWMLNGPLIVLLLGGCAFGLVQLIRLAFEISLTWGLVTVGTAVYMTIAFVFIGGGA